MASPTILDVAARGKPMAFWTKGGSVSASGRRDAKDKGETMPGGSFPIRNSADLARAKHDVGRAKNPAAARQCINKRAEELDEPKLGQSKEARRKMLYTHARSAAHHKD